VPERVGDVLVDAFGGQAQRRALGDDASDRELIDVLDGVALPRTQRGPTAEHDHRDSRVVRVGHPRDGIGEAGSGRDRGDARRARCLRVGRGHHHRRLLVAGIDHADPGVDASVEDRKDVTTAQREDDIDAVLAQRPSDGLAGVVGQPRAGGGRPCEERGPLFTQGRTS
jgi:hypothetical protein